MYICIYVYMYICIYITNCRQYCFGLLGLISAVLMLRWRKDYIATSSDLTYVGSSKPCQSAQTRKTIYIYVYMYIYVCI